MTNIEKNKEITDYFRGNIFESLSSYTEWKMLAYSKSKGIVTEELANKYVEIQNRNKEFFVTTERACLVCFVLLVLHPFDKREDSLSLYKVDKDKTEKFIENNEDIITELRRVRNKVFAHREAEKSADPYQIPSIDRLDQFFEKLIKFYNELTASVDGSMTFFDNAKNTMKRDVENLFISLCRGESVGITESDINLFWGEHNKKASDIL